MQVWFLGKEGLTKWELTFSCQYKAEVPCCWSSLLGNHSTCGAGWAPPRVIPPGTAAHLTPLRTRSAQDRKKMSLLFFRLLYSLTPLPTKSSLATAGASGELDRQLKVCSFCPDRSSRIFLTNSRCSQSKCPLAFSPLASPRALIDRPPAGPLSSCAYQGQLM